MRNVQLTATKASTRKEEIPDHGVSSDGQLPGEIWKDIPGFEGKYQASSLGRIRSLDRYVTVRRGKRDFTRFYPGRLLKANVTRTRPYAKISIGHRIGKEVHVLVAAAFHGPCPEGCEVLHINGNLHDNRPENLRYDTHSENMHDIYYQGGRSKKLNSEDVFQIRFGLMCGIIQKELAEMYQVSSCTINDIKQGRTYGWLTPAQEVLARA